MYITSSANLRNNYRRIANRCKETDEPVFLTTNGEGELVLMSMKAYEDLIAHRKIEKELLRIEADRAAGRADYITLESFEKETDELLRVAESETTGYRYD